jgi:hypothetical protein
VDTDLVAGNLVTCNFIATDVITVDGVAGLVVGYIIAHHVTPSV